MFSYLGFFRNSKVPIEIIDLTLNVNILIKSEILVLWETFTVFTEKFCFPMNVGVCTSECEHMTTELWN